MAKPSIFSKDYERLMKERRKKKNIIIVLIIVISIISMLAIRIDFNNIKEVMEKISLFK